MKYLTLLLSIPAWLIRLVLIFIGITIAVPLSLVGDGEYRTPKMWRLWANVELIPAWWQTASLPSRGWLIPYQALVTGAAWLAYPDSPLIFIFCFFTLLASLALYNDDRFRCFWWMAIRNPTLGLAGVFRQPVPEVKPNPDNIVRDPNGPVSASRFMHHGWYAEFWYLRRIKSDEFFEFRIGWKFVDGNDEFFPTFQLRRGS